LIDEKKLHKPILHFPETHDSNALYPNYGYFELLDWNDWELLRGQPYALMRSTVFLYFQTKKALVWWQNKNEPIQYKDGKIRIAPYIAIFDGYIIVSTDWKEINTGSLYLGGTNAQSIYVRPVFEDEDELNRYFRNDRLPVPQDRAKPVYVISKMTLEYKTMVVNGSDEAPGELGGWLKLTGHKYDGIVAFDFEPAEQTRVTLTGHREIFDHPDESCLGQYFEKGIWEKSGLQQTVISQVDLTPMLSLKEVSDEIHDTRGSMASIDKRISPVIDPSGNLRPEEIREICIEVIDDTYFSDDPDLEKPNPFEKVEDGDSVSYRMNKEAAQDSGDAVVFGTKRGAYDGTPCIEEDYDEFNQFLPNLPTDLETNEDFHPDHVAMIAGPIVIQWGGDGVGENLEIRTGKTLGCGFNCQMKRVSEANPQHKITCWSTTDFDQAVVPLIADLKISHPIQYLPIGIRGWGNTTDPYEQPDPDEEPWFPDEGELTAGVVGSVTVDVSNIPVMTEDNFRILNKSNMVCLFNQSLTRFVCIMLRYLQPGYPDGPWTKVWRVEAGGYRENQRSEWSIFDSHPLPDGDHRFKIEWDHDDLTVTNLTTGDVQTLSLHVSLSFERPAGTWVPWGNGQSEGATTWGTATPLDTILNVTNSEFQDEDE